jgi:hypothetical protein
MREPMIRLGAGQAEVPSRVCEEQQKEQEKVGRGRTKRQVEWTEWAEWAELATERTEFERGGTRRR